MAEGSSAMGFGDGNDLFFSTRILLYLTQVVLDGDIYIARSSLVIV